MHVSHEKRSPWQYCTSERIDFCDHDLCPDQVQEQTLENRIGQYQSESNGSSSFCEVKEVSIDPLQKTWFRHIAKVLCLDNLIFFCLDNLLVIFIR